MTDSEKLEAELLATIDERDAYDRALYAAGKLVSEMVTAGGKYPYINGTELVRDAWGVNGIIDRVRNENGRGEG